MSEYVYATIGDPVANALGEIFLPRCEIVRCRDCMYKTRSEAWPDALDCKRTGLPTDDDLYCAWGERRSE